MILKISFRLLGEIICKSCLGILVFLLGACIVYAFTTIYHIDNGEVNDHDSIKNVNKNTNKRIDKMNRKCK